MDDVAFRALHHQYTELQCEVPRTPEEWRERKARLIELDGIINTELKRRRQTGEPTHGFYGDPPDPDPIEWKTLSWKEKLYYARSDGLHRDD
jgi:hypothetical protein